MPLKLVRVTLDGKFSPGTPAHATGPLMLTKGLEALAPLTAADASEAVDAAVIAHVDARDAWGGPSLPSNEGSPE